MIKAILAVGENGEIGQEGDMPWKRRLPKDLEYFKKMTLNHNVVIGNTTFSTLSFGGKGFPQRDTIVLTRGSWKAPILSDGEAVYFFSGSEVIEENWDEHTLWVAGGRKTYSLLWRMVDEVHVTRVKAPFPEADTYFHIDKFLDEFDKVGEDIDVSGADLEAYVEVWRRIP